jgi:hypothetical protein
MFKCGVVDHLAWPVLMSSVRPGWSMTPVWRVGFYGLGRGFFSFGSVFFSSWVRFWVKNYGSYLARELLWVKNYGPYLSVQLVKSGWTRFFLVGSGGPMIRSSLGPWTTTVMDCQVTITWQPMIVDKRPIRRLMTDKSNQPSIGQQAYSHTVNRLFL